MAPPRGHMFYIGLNREKHEKVFLSKNTRPRVFLFVMKHQFVNLNQVCSNYIPGAKNGPPRGSHVLHKPLPGLFKLCAWGQKRPRARCRQGHGQLSTDTYM